MEWLVGIALILLCIWAFRDLKSHSEEQQKRRVEDDRKRETLLSMQPYFESFERAQTAFTRATRKETRMDRVQLMRAAVEEMREIDPSNQDVLEMRQSVLELELCLLGEMHAEKIDKLARKFEVTDSLPTKKKQMNEIIAACGEAIFEDAPDGDWEEIRERTVRAYYTALVDHFVEKGKKAEFMQQPKVAIDGYREALYELLNDNESGIDHTDQIAWLEARIAGLTT